MLAKLKQTNKNWIVLALLLVILFLLCLFMSGQAVWWDRFPIRVASAFAGEGTEPGFEPFVLTLLPCKWEDGKCLGKPENIVKKEDVDNVTDKTNESAQTFDKTDSAQSNDAPVWNWLLGSAASGSSSTDDSDGSGSGC